MAAPEKARQGAMTQAMRANAWLTAADRALRVAFAQSGRIRSEAMVRSALRVGPDPKSDVVVRDERFRGPLFVEAPDGSWVLHLPARVSGRLAQGGHSERLDAEAHPRRIALAPDARGKLELEDGALLFHLVVPPPPVTKPKLPASVKKGLFGEIDWPFTSFIIGVFSVFLGSSVVLEAADWPVQAVLESPHLQAVLTFEEPNPPPPDPAATWAQDDPDPEPEQEAEAETQPSPERPTARRDNAGRPAPTSDEPVRFTSDEIAAGVSLDIRALTEGGEAFRDLLADGADTSGHAELFDSINAVSGNQQVAGRANVRNTRGSDAEGDCPLGRCLARGPTEAVDTGMRITERTPTVTIRRWEPIDVDTDEFDVRQLVSRVRGKRSLIARCYEQEVTRQPDLEGRVDVEITVMPPGNVQVAIDRNGTGSRRLGECIVGHLRTIRLRRGPERFPAVVGMPFVFAPQR